MRTVALALPVALACAPDESPLLVSSSGLTDGECRVQDGSCSGGWMQVEGGQFVLGEWDPDEITGYDGAVIPAAELTITGFMVEVYPFPGYEGLEWSNDGMDWAQAERMEALLAQYGRRLCTVSELLLASSGRDNWRYPTHPDVFQAGDCDPDDEDPSPLGTYGQCVSSKGVRDLGVRSSWALLDEPLKGLMEAELATIDESLPGDARLAVWGGTSRRTTAHAPTNFGIHFPPPELGPALNQSVRVCADVPGTTPSEDEAWNDVLRLYPSRESYETFLDLAEDYIE